MDISARVLHLIKLYSNHRLLWNPEDTNNKNYELKEVAWHSIAEATGFSTDFCKKKLHSLRSQYRREKMKMRTRNNINYRSKWFAFKTFHFLDEIEGESKLNDVVQTNDEQAEIITCDVEYENMEDDNPATESTEDARITAAEHEDGSLNDIVIKPALRCRMRKKRPKKMMRIPAVTTVSPTPALQIPAPVSSSVSYKSQLDPDDELVVYGNSVTHRLKKLMGDPRILCIVKHKIDNLLYEAEMEAYDNNFGQQKFKTSASSFKKETRNASRDNERQGSIESDSKDFPNNE